MLFVTAAALHAQSPAARNQSRLPISRVLSNPHISSIVEDSEGHIWIGTRRGLNRYNGNTYKPFYAADDSLSLSSDRILSLLPDSDGRLWVGTDAGINLVRGLKVERRAGPAFFPIGAMADFDSRHLVLSYDDGLALYEKDSGRIVPVPTDAGASFSQMMLMSSDSLLWVVGRNYSPEVYIYDKAFRLKKKLSLDEDLVIHSLMESPEKDGVFITTDGGLWLVSSADYSLKPLKEELRRMTEGENILFSAMDADRMILGLAGKGIWSVPLYDGGVSEHLWAEEKLENGNDGLCLLTGDNFIYSKNHIGFSVKLRLQNLHRFSPEGLRPNENILHLHQSGDSPLIAVTTRGIYLIFAEDGHQGLRSVRHEFTECPLISNSFLDRRQRLWILGSDNVIQRYHVEDERLVREEAVRVTGSGCFFEETGGAVCFLQNGGMLLFNPDGSTTRQSLPSSLSFQFAQNLPSGDIYLMSENKLYRFTRDRQFLRIPVDIISPVTVAEDWMGRLWIGSISDGLICWDPSDNSVFSFGQKNGLTDESIRSLVADSLGNLWCTTRSDLFLIDVEKLTAIAMQYSEESVFNFLTDASATDSDGRITFGSMRSILFLDPLLPINDKQIPVEIEAVSVNNGEIPLDSDRLILSHEQNLLSFYYSAWDYPIGANLNYSYRLLGLDKEWVNIGNYQQAHYSNLSPGRYTFQVRAQRLDGNWQEPGASLQIRIRPSFWASTAMKICYFAILAAVLAFFLKNRISSRLKQDKLDFITNISHEYRTPLSLIYGPVRELSASGSLTGRDRELVDIIARSAERLHRLSGQVMDLNRFENGREFLEVSRCDLSPILNDIASSFSWQMERKRLDCVRKLPESLPAWCDGEKIEKIVFNLFSNAVKYTPEGGRITLVAAKDGDRITISVQDNGNGISDEKKARIFKRYERLAGDSRGHLADGFGIGLNYAQHLAKLHRAELRISDVKPHGAEFSLSFASDKEAWSPEELLDVRKEMVSEVPISDLQAAEEKKDIRILIVEDNMEMRSYLSRLLSRQYSTSTAENGVQAISLIEKEQPDIIISDVVMPGMDGFTLCSTLKGKLDTCHIPVVLLTAKTDMQNRIAGMENGADAYISKPFDPSYLQAAVANILENRKRTQQALDGRSGAISESAGKELQVSSRDREFLDKVFRLIDSHLDDENFSITQLAEELHISRSNFFYKMKSLTGLSPQEFLISYRLNRSVELLKTREYSVSEVAYKVGFSTLNGFSKAFRKKFGTPPSSV